MRPVNSRRPLPRLALCLVVVLLAILAGTRPVLPTAATAATFSNPAAIPINDALDLSGTQPGTSIPYPVPITVAGLGGAVTKVTATVDGFSHTYQEDISFALVGPQGQSVGLLSGTGGSQDSVDVTLTFDDAASGQIPAAGVPFVSGTYQPTYRANNTFPAPAAPTPFAASLGAAFNGSDPNGTWNLYIIDSYSRDIGGIARGWSLTITTAAATTLTAAAASGTYGGTTNLAATLATGGTPVAGRPVTFTLNGAVACGTGSSPACPVTDANGVASLPGVSLAGITAGTYPGGVGAAFAGDADYTPSGGVGDLTVSRTGQVITFEPNPLPDRTLGDPPFTVSATASSGLTVTFAAAPAGVCTTSGTNGATITLIGAGTCTVTASQPGDAGYLAAPDVARSFAVVQPKVGVTVTVSGPGAVSPGTGTYPPGPLTLTAAPDGGALFTGWRVDGVVVGWGPTLTLNVTGARTINARFAARPAFADVAPSAVAWDAIIQLAARGIIKGYGDGNFGPTDTVLRAQEAALIVRALGWDGTAPGGPAPFADLGGVDPELQRAIAILAQRGIINGYGGGTFGPTDEVVHVQAISFITRSMVQAGYWTAVTVDNPALYPNVPLSSGHRLDLLTFVQYAGAIPDRPSNQTWADWETSASRGWMARVIWQALDSYFQTNRVP